MRPLLLSLVVFIAFTSSASAAEWQRASLITPPNAQVPEVKTAVSDSGETLVLWKASDTLMFRTRVRGQNAGPAVQPATDVSRTWTMAADRQGNAVVAWVVANGGADNIVAARFRPAGGEFGPVQVVAAPENQASQLQVALAPTGESVIAWRDLGTGASQRRLRAAVRAPGASFGPPQTLATGEPGLRSLGIDDSGNALVAWTDRRAVRVSRHPAGGGFADPQDLATPGAELKGELTMDVDPAGAAVIAFSDGPADGAVTSAHVTTARGTAEGGFGTSRIVSGPFARDLVADARGDHAAVAWRAASGRRSRVQVAVDGEATRSLSLRNARSPDVAVTVNGRATVAWQRLTDRGRAIEAAGRAPASQFPDVAERVSTFGDVGSPVLESNARGDQFLAWIRSGRGLSRAESAKASSPAGRFTRVLPVYDGRVSVRESVNTIYLQPAGDVMQAVYERTVGPDRRFWDLSTYGEPTG